MLFLYFKRDEIAEFIEDPGTNKLINALFYPKLEFLKSKKDYEREKLNRRNRKMEIKEEIK